MASHGAFVTLFDSVAGVLLPRTLRAWNPTKVQGLDGGCAPPSFRDRLHVAQGCSGAGSQRNRGSESTTTVGIEAG